VTDDSLEAALEDVRERIAAACRRAGRDASTVRLVAVSKTVDVDRVRALAELGQRDMGENRAQELLAKAAQLPPAIAVTWHFVGRLQRNKVARLAPRVAWWHSIDVLASGEAVARHAPGARVLVQVNLAEEPQKGGVAPAAVPALVDALRSLALDVRGLMTVPPMGVDPRPHFARLRDLGHGLGLPDLSMGMSGDFEAAVAEGATIVRVGTALFGVRQSGGRPG
jgi:pyridoxal phosphate enzyme (YggS family)